MMEKNLIVNQIRGLLNTIENEPYGHERHNKTIPPDAYSYARLVEALIDKLLCLHNIDSDLISINTIQNIQSIKENEIRHLFITHQKGISKDFDTYHIDKEMEAISGQIKFYISYIFNDER